MLFEQITNELVNIQNKVITKDLELFVEGIKKQPDIYLKQTKTLQKVATQLNVPVGFIINVLRYERIDEQ